MGARMTHFHNPPKPKRQHPEFHIQVAIVGFLHYALPDDTWFTAIPGGNLGGGADSDLRGQWTRQMGLRKGAPDIFILWRQLAIFLEVKAEKGALSSDQVVQHQQITLSGGICHVVRSIDETEAILRVLGVPLRGSAALAPKPGYVPVRRNLPKKPGKRAIQNAIKMYQP
jgi:hypothetical protein